MTRNVIRTTAGNVNLLYSTERYADLSVRAVSSGNHTSPGLRTSVTGVTVMANIAEVRRVVHAHQWQDLSEWVRILDQLADLTDDEIDGVIGKAIPCETLPSAA